MLHVLRRALDPEEESRDMRVPEFAGLLDRLYHGFRESTLGIRATGSESVLIWTQTECKIDLVP